MCGVFFCARRAQDDTPSLQNLCERLQDVNAARGPDSQDAQRVLLTASDNLSNSTAGYNRVIILDLFASELRLRGRDPVVQPHEQDGNIFCWNGEIAKEENDGVKLFHALRLLETPEQSAMGFYRLTDLQAASQRVFFARDPLGRRSLLIHKPSARNPYCLLASVSAGSDPSCDFEEVSTEYIHCLNLGDLIDANDIASAFNSCVTSIPRSSAAALYGEPCRVNDELPPDGWPLISSLETPDHLAQAVDDLIDHLNRSVELRVRDIPQSSDRKGMARVAVLFSGGIDSTVLAFLAHKHILLNEPIDLLNVAFENPRKIKVQTEGYINKRQKRPPTNPPPPYMVPDRVTGLQEVEELRRICPRVWNFVEVNVPYEESQAAHPVVESLMLPGKTIMDLSLALAFDPDAQPIPYTTPARVLLNGLGSDELLGGYGRHRTAYGTGGWKAVIDELQLEINRIPSRNLGRDDRVISSHGKETRHPFLSLTVVSFLARLPVYLKTDPRAETGLGDKMLLRLAAKKLGLVEASRRKKRAMQFGSHSARMEADKRGDLLLASS
ncbi:asparagine synthase-domain-containing protein [Mycena sp. CBHHK59/15]|nr:asparagine synthase-domain-containing protein [Mycena sp. CBHHK59/15]